MNKNVIIIILFIFFSFETFAQSNITLPLFPEYTTNWTWPVGTSYLNADTFVLTNAVGDQSGYAYFNYLANLISSTSDFTVNFDFRIDSGADATDTSDGITFFFLKRGYSYSGSIGESIGLPSNDTGLVIIFDTHDNDGNGNNPLISMRYLEGTPYDEGSSTGLLTPDLGNQYFICDARWHHCAIGYSSGNITIAFDGHATLMTGYYLLNSYGNFGFSGSTGGGYSNQAISNVTINASIILPCDTPAIASFTFLPSTLLSDTSITFTNNSVHANNYLWDFGDSSTSTETNPIHQFNKTGTYDVCLTASKGDSCQSTICKKVSTEINLIVGIPSAFSPNGDGENDILYVRGKEIKMLNLKIYNRFGQVVFESNDINSGWDGKFMGQDQPMDTYGYVLNVVCLDGTAKLLKGNVTILR